MLLERSVSLIAPPSAGGEPQIDVRRTAQAVSYLLGLAGGRMPYGRTMLMLYLADRDALLQRARPITYDEYAATPAGPVPIAVAHLFFSPLHALEEWRAVVRREGEEAIAQPDPPTLDRLSKHDRLLLDGAYAALDGLDLSRTLEEMARLCPEWLEWLGRKIPTAAILETGGESPDDARAIVGQIAAERRLRMRRGHSPA